MGNVPISGVRRLAMKIRAIVNLVVLILMASVSSAWSGQTGTLSAKVAKELTHSTDMPMRVIVVLDVPAGTVFERQQQIKRAAATVSSGISATAQTVRTYDHFAMMAMQVTDKSALDSLAQMPQVRFVVPDRRHPIPKTTKSLPETNQAQLYPQNVDIIGAEAAWAAGYTGAGWYVAVLDSGVLTTHEAFAGKNIVEACFSQDGYCPNGQKTMYGPGSAKPFNSNYDGYDHGTAVASVAVGNSGKLFGVAKDASLISIQVFSAFTSPSDCYPFSAPCLSSYDSDELAALDYVYSLRNTYPIAVVNMSLGGEEYEDQQTCDTSEDDPPYITAINSLREAGIPVIIASGNDGSCNGIESLACVSPAISVGAVDDTDTEAGFNDWHYSMLKFLAPGVNVYCATPDSPTSYESLEGTSLSAPQVSGAWAVLKQKNPDASVDELFSAFTDTGVPVQTACKSIDDYKPRIQVDAALAAAPNPLPSTSRNFSYPAAASPVLNFSQPMPVGVGPVAGRSSTLNFQVGLAAFAHPVDVYLGINAQPVAPSTIYLFTQDNNLQPLSAELTPWRQNVTGSIEESLFGEFSSSTLPSGQYTIYLMVTPSGQLGPYDLWSTSFSLQQPFPRR
jgi:subtilisin family serine protease